MCGFGVYQALAYNEVHTRSEFNQDCSPGVEIFSNNRGCNFVIYEIAIIQIVTLQGKLNRAGDL